MKNPKAYVKEILADALPKYCKGDVVDVGAGRGKYKALIKAHAGSYTAVDNMSSEYQYDESMDKPDVVSDVLHMPFPDNTFDTVICTEVLEHVEDPFQLFSEVSRILKPGGYALMSSGWIAAYHQEPKDYWRFSIDTYGLLCKKNSLELVESYKKGGLFTAIFYLLNRNIKLNTVSHHIFTKIWIKGSKFLERVAEKMDGLIKTEDTVGHLIVAHKKA